MVYETVNFLKSRRRLDLLLPEHLAHRLHGTSFVLAEGGYYYQINNRFHKKPYSTPCSLLILMVVFNAHNPPPKKACVESSCNLPKVQIVVEEDSGAHCCSLNSMAMFLHSKRKLLNSQPHLLLWMAFSVGDPDLFS